MMQVNSYVEEQENGTVVKRLSVPVGLEELMTGLTKEVLQKKPRDIYTFASEHFAQLLALRDNGNYQQAPSKSITYASKESVENLLGNGKTPKSSNGTPTKLSRQVSIRADSPIRKNGPKIKRSGTPKHDGNNNDDGKNKDKHDKKRPVISRRQTPGSKSKFDSLEPVKEDALKMLTKRQSLSRRSTDRKSKSESEHSKDSKRSSSDESERKKRSSRDASLKKKPIEKKVQSGDSKELKHKEKPKGKKEETKKKSVEETATKSKKVQEDLGLQHSGEIHDILIPEETTDDSSRNKSKDKKEDIKNEHQEKFIIKSPSIEESTTGVKDGRLTVTPPKILKGAQTSSDNFDLPPTLIVPVLAAAAAATSLNDQKAPNPSTPTAEQGDEIKADLQEDSETGEIVSSSKDEDEETSSKSYDPAALREELQKVEEESKLNNFTSSYNPYKLKQEIKNASKGVEENEKKQEESSVQSSSVSVGDGALPKPAESDEEKKTEATTESREPDAIVEKGIEGTHLKEDSHEKKQEETTIDAVLQQPNVVGQPENNKLQLLHAQTAVSEGSTTGSIEGTSLDNKEMPEEDSIEEKKVKKSSTIVLATNTESPVVLGSTSGLQHSEELHDQVIPKEPGASAENSTLEKSPTTPDADSTILESSLRLQHSGELHDQAILKEFGKYNDVSIVLDKSSPTKVPKSVSPVVLKSTSGLQHSGELHDQLVLKEDDEDKNTSNQKNVAEIEKPQEASSTFGLQHSGELHDQLIPNEISEAEVQRSPTLNIQHSGELHDTVIPKQTNVENGHEKTPSPDLKQVEKLAKTPKAMYESVEGKNLIEESLERPSSVIIEKDKHLFKNEEAESKDKPKHKNDEDADKLSIGETIAQAASKIQAGVRGYLTRKLYKSKTPPATNEKIEDVADKKTPNKLSDEELQEALTQLDSIPVPSESPHTSRHKRETTPVDLIDVQIEDSTEQKDKLPRSQTVHGPESAKYLAPSLFKSVSVTDSALSKTLDEDEEKLHESTEESISLEHTEDLGIESEKSVVLLSETTAKNVNEETIEEASTTASLEHSGELHDTLIPKESETDGQITESQHDLEEQSLKVLEDGKPAAQEVEIIPNASVSPKESHQLASTAGLQHSGEIHDILIPKEAENEVQKGKTLNTETLQHSGELHDLLIPKETLQEMQGDNTLIKDDLQHSGEQQLSKEDKTDQEEDDGKMKENFQHTGGLHDIIVATEDEDLSEKIKNGNKLVKDSLQHSGELHDVLIPKEVEKTLQEANYVKNLVTENIQASVKPPEETSPKLHSDNTLIKDDIQHSDEQQLPKKDETTDLALKDDDKVKKTLQHSGELHDIVAPIEVEAIQDDKKLAKNSLQHSGELHDILIPNQVEETFQKTKDVENLGTESLQGSGNLQEKISQELENNKTLIKDDLQHDEEQQLAKETKTTDQDLPNKDKMKENLQHTGELHDIVVPIQVEVIQDDKKLAKDNLQHSGELHDVLIPKEVEKTLQDAKDVKNVATESVQSNGNLPEKISQELQDDKTLIKDDLQHGKEQQLAKEVETTNQELQDDVEMGKNLQHTGELHDIVVPTEIEGISLKPKDDKKLVKDSLQHSGELHDVLIPKQISQELQDADEIKENLQHNEETHDLLTPKESEIEEGIEVPITEANKSTKPSFDDQKDFDKKPTEEKTYDANKPSPSHKDQDQNGSYDSTQQASGLASVSGLQHSGELHDVLIPQNEVVSKTAEEETVQVEEKIKPSSASTISATPTKLASTDGFHHSGEMHDHLIPQENLNKNDLNDESFTDSPENVEDNQPFLESHKMEEATAVLVEEESKSTPTPSSTSNLQESVGLQHTGELHDILIAEQAKKDFQDEGTKDDSKPLALNQVQNVEVAKVEYSGNEYTLNQPCTPSVLAESPKLEEGKAIASATPGFDLQHDTTSSEIVNKSPPPQDTQKEITKPAESSSPITTEPAHHELKTDAPMQLENALVVKHTLTTAQELADNTDKPSPPEDDKVLIDKIEPQDENNKIREVRILSASKESGKDVKPQEGSPDDTKTVFDASKLNAEVEEVSKPVGESNDEILEPAENKIVENTVELKKENLNQAEKVSDEELSESGKVTKKNEDLKVIEDQIFQEDEVDNVSEDQGIGDLSPSKLRTELEPGKLAKDHKHETITENKKKLDNDRTKDQEHEQEGEKKESKKAEVQEMEDTNAEEGKRQNDLHENNKDDVSVEIPKSGLKKAGNQEVGNEETLKIGTGVEATKEAEIKIEEQIPNAVQTNIDEAKDDDVSGKKSFEDVDHSNKTFDISKLQAEIKEAAKDQNEESQSIDNAAETTNDNISQEVNKVVFEEGTTPVKIASNETVFHEHQINNEIEENLLEDVNGLNKSFDISQPQSELQDAAKQEYKEEGNAIEITNNKISQEVQKVADKKRDTTAIDEKVSDVLQKDDLSEDLNESKKSFDISKLRAELEETGKETEKKTINKKVPDQESPEISEKETHEEETHSSLHEDGEPNPLEDNNTSKTAFDISKLRAELEETGKETEKDKTEPTIDGSVRIEATVGEKIQKDAVQENYQGIESKVKEETVLQEDQKFNASEEKLSEDVNGSNTSFDISQLHSELEETGKETEINKTEPEIDSSAEIEAIFHEKIPKVTVQENSLEVETKVKEKTVLQEDLKPIASKRKPLEDINDSNTSFDISKLRAELEEAGTEKDKTESAIDNSDVLDKNEPTHIEDQVKEAKVQEENGQTALDESSKKNIPEENLTEDVSNSKKPFDIAQLRVEIEKKGKDTEDQVSEGKCEEVKKEREEEKVEKQDNQNSLNKSEKNVVPVNNISEAVADSNKSFDISKLRAELESAGKETKNDEEHVNNATLKVVKAGEIQSVQSDDDLNKGQTADAIRAITEKEAEEEKPKEEDKPKEENKPKEEDKQTALDKSAKNGVADSSNIFDISKLRAELESAGKETQNNEEPADNATVSRINTEEPETKAVKETTQSDDDQKNITPEEKPSGNVADVNKSFNISKLRRELKEAGKETKENNIDIVDDSKIGSQDDEAVQETIAKKRSAQSLRSEATKDDKEETNIQKEENQSAVDANKEGNISGDKPSGGIIQKPEFEENGKQHDEPATDAEFDNKATERNTKDSSNVFDIAEDEELDTVKNMQDKTETEEIKTLSNENNTTEEENIKNKTKQISGSESPKEVKTLDLSKLRSELEEAEILKEDENKSAQSVIEDSHQDKIPEEKSHDDISQPKTFDILKLRSELQEAGKPAEDDKRDISIDTGAASEKIDIDIKKDIKEKTPLNEDLEKSADHSEPMTIIKHDKNQQELKKDKEKKDYDKEDSRNEDNKEAIPLDEDVERLVVHSEPRTPIIVNKNQQKLGADIEKEDYDQKDVEKENNRTKDNTEETPLNKDLEKSTDSSEPTAFIIDDKNQQKFKEDNEKKDYDKEVNEKEDNEKEDSEKENNKKQDNKEQIPLNNVKSTDHLKPKHQSEPKTLIKKDKIKEESKEDIKKEDNEKEDNGYEDIKQQIPLTSVQTSIDHSEPKNLIMDDKNKPKLIKDNKNEDNEKQKTINKNLENSDPSEQKTFIMDDKNKQKSKEDNKKEDNKKEDNKKEGNKKEDNEKKEKQTPLNKELKSADHSEPKSLITDNKIKQESKEDNEKSIKQFLSEEKTDSENNQVINIPTLALNSTPLALSNVSTPIQSADRNSQNNLLDESSTNVYESAPTRPVTSDITPNIIPNENIQIPPGNLHKQARDIEQIIKPGIESDENFALEVENYEAAKAENAVQGNNDSKEEAKMQKSPNKNILHLNKKLSLLNDGEVKVINTKHEISDDSKIKVEEEGERPVSITSTTSTDSLATVITVSPREQSEDRKNNLTRSLSNSSEKSEDSKNDTQIEDKMSSVLTKHEAKHEEEPNEKQEKIGKEEDTKDAAVKNVDRSELKAEVQEVAEEEGKPETLPNPPTKNVSITSDHEDFKENVSKSKENKSLEANIHEKIPEIEDRQLGKDEKSSKSPEQPSQDLKAEVVKDTSTLNTSGLKIEKPFSDSHEAATTIQSNYRGYRVRKDLGKYSLGRQEENVKSPEQLFHDLKAEVIKDKQLGMKEKSSKSPEQQPSLDLKAQVIEDPSTNDTSGLKTEEPSDDRHGAATTIQSNYRGYRVRKDLGKYKIEEASNAPQIALGKKEESLKSPEQPPQVLKLQVIYDTLTPKSLGSKIEETSDDPKIEDEQLGKKEGNFKLSEQQDLKAQVIEDTILPQSSGSMIEESFYVPQIEDKESGRAEESLKLPEQKPTQGLKAQEIADTLTHTASDLKIEEAFDGKHGAATTIQSNYRGYRVRKNVGKYKIGETSNNPQIGDTQLGRKQETLKSPEQPSLDLKTKLIGDTLTPKGSDSNVEETSDAPQIEDKQLGREEESLKSSEEKSSQDLKAQIIGDTLTHNASGLNLEEAFGYKHGAATTIQSNYRGYRVRRDLDKSTLGEEDKSLKSPEQQPSEDLKARVIDKSLTLDVPHIEDKQSGSEEKSLKPTEQPSQDLKAQLIGDQLTDDTFGLKIEETFDDKHAAATTIQSNYRGYRVRRDLDKYSLNTAQEELGVLDKEEREKQPTVDSININEHIKDTLLQHIDNEDTDTIFPVDSATLKSNPINLQKSEVVEDVMTKETSSGTQSAKSRDSTMSNESPVDRQKSELVENLKTEETSSDKQSAKSRDLTILTKSPTDLQKSELVEDLKTKEMSSGKQSAKSRDSIMLSESLTDLQKSELVEDVKTKETSLGKQSAKSRDSMILSESPVDLQKSELVEGVKTEETSSGKQSATSRDSTMSNESPVDRQKSELVEDVKTEETSSGKQSAKSRDSTMSNESPVGRQKSELVEDLKTEETSSDKQSAKGRDSTILTKSLVDLQKSELVEDLKTKETSSGKQSAKSRDSIILSESPTVHQKSELVEDLKTKEMSSGKQSAKSRDSIMLSESLTDLQKSELVEDVKTKETSLGKQSAKSRDSMILSESPVDLKKSELVEGVKTEKTSSGKQSATSRDSTMSNESPVDRQKSELVEDVKTEETSSGKQSAKSRDSTMSNESPVGRQKSELVEDLKTEETSSGKQSAKSRDSTIMSKSSVDLQKSELFEDLKTKETFSGKQSAKSRDSIILSESATDLHKSKLVEDVKTEETPLGKQSPKSHDSNESPMDIRKSGIIDDLKTDKTSSTNINDSTILNESLVDLQKSETVKDTRNKETFLEKQLAEGFDPTTSAKEETKEKIFVKSEKTTKGVASLKVGGKNTEDIEETEEDKDVGFTPHMIATAPPLHLLDDEDDYDLWTEFSENPLDYDVVTTIDPYKNATAPPDILLDETEDEHLITIAKSKELLLSSPAEKDPQGLKLEVSSPIEAIISTSPIKQELLPSKKIEEKSQQSSAVEKNEAQEDLSKQPNLSEETEDVLTNKPRNLEVEELPYYNKYMQHMPSPRFHGDAAGAVPKALDVVLDQQLAITAPNAAEKQDSIESEGPEYIYIPLKDPAEASTSTDPSTSALQHSGEFHDTPVLNLKQEEQVRKDLNLETEALRKEESKIEATMDFLLPEDFTSSKYDLVQSGVSPRTRQEEGAVPKALGVVLDQQLAITAPKAKDKQEDSKSEPPEYIHIPLKDPVEASTFTEASNITEVPTSGLQHTGELHDTIPVPLLNLNQEEETHKNLNLAADIEHEKESKTKDGGIAKDFIEDFASSKYDLVESGVNPRTHKEEEGAVPKALSTVLDQQLAITTPRAEEKRDDLERPEYIYIPLKDLDKPSTSTGLHHSGELHDTIVRPFFDEKQKEENLAKEKYTKNISMPVYEEKVKAITEDTSDNSTDELDGSKYDLLKYGVTPRIRKEQEGAVPKVLGVVLDQQLAITTPLGKPKEEKDESADPKYIYIPLKDSNEPSTFQKDGNGLQGKDTSKPSQEKEVQSKDANRPSSFQEKELTNGFHDKDKASPVQEKDLEYNEPLIFQEKKLTTLYKPSLSQNQELFDKSSTSEQFLNGHHPTNGFLEKGEKELENDLQDKKEINKTITVSSLQNQSQKSEERQYLNLPIDHEAAKTSSVELTVKDKSSSLSPASSNQYSVDVPIPPTPCVEETSVLDHDLDKSKTEEPSMIKISAAKSSFSDIKHKDQTDPKSELLELASPVTISSNMKNLPTSPSVFVQSFSNNGTDPKSPTMTSPIQKDQEISTLSFDQPGLQNVHSPTLGLHLRFTPSPTHGLEGRPKSFSPNSETGGSSPITGRIENLTSGREDRSIQSDSPPIVIQSAQISDNTMPLAVQLNQAPGAAVLTSPTPNDDDDDAGESLGAHAPGKGASTKVEAGKHCAHFRTSMETDKRKNATIKEKNMEADAATKIQAGFRGYQVRKQLKLKNGGVDSVRRSLRRKSSGKLRGSEKASQKASSKPSDLEQKSATKIQAGIRGFLVRRRQQKNGKNNTTPESS